MHVVYRMPRNPRRPARSAAVRASAVPEPAVPVDFSRYKRKSRVYFVAYPCFLHFLLAGFLTLVLLPWLVGDGFYPNVDPLIAARHRKSRRLNRKLRRTRFRGVVPLFSYSVFSLFVCLLFILFAFLRAI
jgi:hypothetical protein